MYQMHFGRGRGGKRKKNDFKRSAHNKTASCRHSEAVASHPVPTATSLILFHPLSHRRLFTFCGNACNRGNEHGGVVQKNQISCTVVDCILFIRRSDKAKGTSSCLRPTYDTNRVTKGGGRTAAENENRKISSQIPLGRKTELLSPSRSIIRVLSPLISLPTVKFQSDKRKDN